MEKIIAFKQLSSVIGQINQPKVLVGGCFDILHLGHVRFLKEAKKYGSVIVALESDERLKNSKGSSRPIHKQTERAEILAELTCVDVVILLPYFKTYTEYADLTNIVAPTAIAVTQGDEQLDNKQKHAALVGAKIIQIPKIETPSTTQLAKLLELETN